MAYTTRRPSTAILSLSFAAMACVGFSDDSPKNLTFSTALKSVSVFRDGFGYFVREGKVKLEDGWATTNVVPTAVRGTIRFYALDKGDRIDQVDIVKDNRVDFNGSKDLKTKLGDKVGLKLNVTTKANQKFSGELAKILDDMLLLKAGDAYNGIPYDQVKEITLDGYPVRIKVATSNPNKVVGLGVAYLQEGIKWEPSYVLDVKGGSGTLALRASMQNTTEKLDKTDVFFVVGSPYLANRGIQDMLAPNPATPPPPAKNGTADKDRIVSVKPIGDPDEAEAAATQASKTNATISRDEAGELYYYHKPGLSLDSNDIAMVSVFENEVPVMPSFEWNADGEEVAYLLNIQNKSNQPLTTGPVLVLEDGRAVGQENVKYTPAGGSAEIRLSQGIGLKVDKTEAEVRRGAPAHVGKTDYIPVILKGTLTITNFRGTKATVKITKTLRGKVDTLSDGGKIKQTQILNGEPNPTNDVEWKVDVAPNETKTINYTFETFMSAERAGSPPVPVSGSGD